MSFVKAQRDSQLFLRGKVDALALVTVAESGVVDPYSFFLHGFLPK